MPPLAHPWTGQETGPLDDAALLHSGSGGPTLVYTIDVITAVVDDPADFGRIAAANALSDVYAMGGAPQVALSFAGLPTSLGLDVLRDVLAGMNEKAAEAGCAVVGGHTICDNEPKCGLAVIGTVDPVKAWTQTRAQAGQRLVLTKALGTGVITQAARAGIVEGDVLSRAVESMERLNAAARDAGLRHGVTAATDVTGFGLLGHLHHLASASGLEARVDPRRVPLLDGARALAARGQVPGGTKRNQRYVDAHLEGADALDPALLTLLCDAQTSGGLLLTVDEAGARAICDELPGAAIIGELARGNAGRLSLVEGT